MPVVTYNYSGPLSGALALELLAKLQDTELVVSVAADAKPTLTVVTNNPIVGSSSTSSSESWAVCAKALSSLIPSLRFWDEGVEQWIHSAAIILDSDSEKPVVDFVSELEAHLNKNGDKTYLIGEFSAADVCVSIWCASAMIKFDLVSEKQKSVCDWVSNTLKALVPYDENKVSKLLADLEIGVATKLVDDLKVSDVHHNDSFSDNASVSKLREFGLKFEVYAHEACMTADELVEKVLLPSNKETHTKNLFFKDKKHGLFLVTQAVSSTFNTKQLGALLNLQGKVNMRLANAEALEKCLQVKSGCVGPLCIVNDSSKEVTLVVDKTLLDGSYDYIHSHPLRNDASVKMKPTVLEDFFKKAGVEPAVVDFSSEIDSAATSKPAASGKNTSSKGKQKKAPQKKAKSNQNEKGKTKLALQYKKAENFPMWYSNVIVLSEMISYYDISGCYILRPWSYKIWDLMQQWFNKKILKLGVENSYFPLFVSQDRLEKEKDHVEGFAPEVAWVTKSGDGELAKPIAIRPTSETIMYPAFSDWIKSHRDLPLKLNQWSNVVRWEFKDPTPFLRSREFLWQEGHTAHATYEEADEMVMAALDLYKQAYQDLLCVPVIPGYKSKHERFAGGHQTTTVEAYIPISGRAIQGATSHNLGQNFGKMFDIKFQDEKGESKIVWQTSWGLTTRTIGVMVMVHGDDKGLVMPPRVAPLQAVVVPILSKKLLMEDANPYCLSVLEDLESQGLRAKYDDRAMYNPGWKYNHWEQKGVPIRIEVGPMDIEKKQVRAVIRHNGEKIDLPLEGLGAYIKDKMEDIHTAMFEKASAERDAHVVQVTEWKDFVPNLEKHNLVLTPWCGPEHEDWEEWVKKTSREESLANIGEEEEDDRAATSVAAKTLCIPFDQPELPEGSKCIASGMAATCWILWGRSY